VGRCPPRSGLAPSRRAKARSRRSRTADPYQGH
jgi:hypothetical protein